MNPIQQAKVKSLIQVSAILDVKEKQEWLQLLGVMNDKQALELQTILEGDFKKAEGIADRGQNVQKQPVTSLEFQKPTSNLPILSHILNVPTGNVTTYQNFSGKQIQPTESQKNLNQKPDNFLKKLKNLLTTKELLKGHPDPLEELELAERRQEIPRNVTKSPTLTTAQAKFGGPGSLPPVVPLKPKAGFTISSMVNSDSSAQSQKISTATLNLKNQASTKLPGAIKDQSGLRVAVTANLPNPLDLAKHVSQNAGLRLPNLLLRKNEPVTGGVVGKSNVLNKSILQNAGLPPAIIQKTEVKNLQTIEDQTREKVSTGKVVGFGSLEETEKITIENFENSDFNLVVKTLKSLAAEKGMQRLFFSLEKSPLYKAYLQTGTQVLAKKLNFDNFSSGSQSGFLNRKCFEDFADLLIEIQSG